MLFCFWKDFFLTLDVSQGSALVLLSKESRVSKFKSKYFSRSMTLEMLQKV